MLKATAFNTDEASNAGHIPEKCCFFPLCAQKYIKRSSDTQLSDHLLENEGSGVPRCIKVVVSQADVESNT